MCCYTTLWNVKSRKTSNNLNQVTLFNDKSINCQRTSQTISKVADAVTTNTQNALLQPEHRHAGICATGRWHHQSRSVAVQPRPQAVTLSTRSRPSLFSGRPDLASLPKSCNLLGWDLGYSEATDQMRWMRASPVAAAWLSRVPCGPMHVLLEHEEVARHLSYGR